MKPTTLIAFRKGRKLTQTACAKALGVGRRSLIRYEAGEKPIPVTVALACAALAFGLPPME